MEHPYRLLVVGCGLIAQEWLDVLQTREDCLIAGLADTNREAAEERRRAYGLTCPVYTDFDQALEAVRPHIVIDLAYPGAHCDLTLRSLAAGCHVFGEKPMCMSREEGAALLEAVKTSGLAFNVMQNRRYLPGIRALRHAVRSGRLGKIWTVCCEIYVNSDLRSVRNQLPYPMLQDQAIHSFDSARFILGADAKTVYCHSYNPEGSHYRGDGSGACIFEMTDGSVLVYNAVMDTNVLRTSWHSQWRIIGSRGTALWDGFDGLPTAELLAEDGAVERVRLEPPEEWNGLSWFAGAIDEMLGALREGRVSENSCLYNYGSVAMTLAAIESAQAGRRVAVEDRPHGSKNPKNSF